MSIVIARPDCDETHLFGLAAIDCIDETVERLRAERPDLMPVQRCDPCSAYLWLDIDAARAVAERMGTTVEVINEQPFVLRT